MTAEHAGDMIDGAAYTVDELRKAVFEGEGRVSRPLALGLLARKDYRDKVADLKRILTDEKEQPRLRVLAASALGEIDTAASVRALEQGVRSEESVTVRAAAKALANVGGRKHVKLLQDLAEGPGPVGRDAQRAMTVLGERLKAEAPTHGELPTLSVQATGQPTRIRVEAAKAADAASAVKSSPTRKLARRGAVSLTCQGRQLVFVFEEASLGRGLDMVRQGGEIGIVAEPPGVEAAAWYPRYRVTVEPQAKNAFRVLVTTPDGRPVLAGEGATEGRKATFALAAVDAPGALPVEIRGRFDGRRVTFDQARAAVRRQPSRTPPAENGPPAEPLS